MSTTLQNDVTFETNNIICIHLQAYGDTDQTAVEIIDISGLEGPDTKESPNANAPAPSKLALLEAKWSIQGWEYVQLLWDADTDDEMITMSGDGEYNGRGYGGKQDPQSTGSTGDVKLTSQGAGTDSSYNIELVFKKKA